MLVTLSGIVIDVRDLQPSYIDNTDYQSFVVDMVEKWSDFFEG